MPNSVPHRPVRRRARRFLARPPHRRHGLRRVCSCTPAAGLCRVFRFVRQGEMPVGFFTLRTHQCPRRIRVPRASSAGVRASCSLHPNCMRPSRHSDPHCGLVRCRSSASSYGISPNMNLVVQACRTATACAVVTLALGPAATSAHAITLAIDPSQSSVTYTPGGFSFGGPDGGLTPSAVRHRLRGRFLPEQLQLHRCGPGCDRARARHAGLPCNRCVWAGCCTSSPRRT